MADAAASVPVCTPSMNSSQHGRPNIRAQIADWAGSICAGRCLHAGIPGNDVNSQRTNNSDAGLRGTTVAELVDLFPDFASEWIATRRGRIFARIGGDGPPLLLLHGYPQTHVMWHRVVPQLVGRFRLVIADL